MFLAITFRSTRDPLDVGIIVRKENTEIIELTIKNIPPS
jgi:hypothetical protein